MDIPYSLAPGDRLLISPTSGTLNVLVDTPDQVVVECVAEQPPPPPPPGQNLLQYPEFAVPGMNQGDDPLAPWQVENGYWGLSLKDSNPSPNDFALKGKLGTDGAGTEHSAKFPNGAADRCWQDVTAPPHTQVTLSYQEVGRDGALLKSLYGRNDPAEPWQALWSAEKENPSDRDWSDPISHVVQVNYAEYRFEVFYQPVSPSGYKITNVSLVPT